MTTKKTPYWPAHPLADLFPRMTPEEFTELKKDMADRVERGLDPLEHNLILYQDKILDGRHRHDAWLQLAEEHPDSYFSRTTPPFERFAPDKDGTLGAWLRAKSLNMIGRQLSAEQRVAILLKAAEDHPEIKAALEAVKSENIERQKTGKPLDPNAQRGNTAEQIGQIAGAGATTVKNVLKFQREAPERLDEVVAGKTSAKQAAAGLPNKNKKPKSGTPPKPNPDKKGKGKPPKVTEVLGLVLQGLGSVKEAETPKKAPGVISFTFKGHKVKVRCEIV